MSTYNDVPEPMDPLHKISFVAGGIVIILVVLMSLCECEPVPVKSVLKAEVDSGVHFIVTFPDFEDTIITITY